MKLIGVIARTAEESAVNESSCQESTLRKKDLEVHFADKTINDY